MAPEETTSRSRLSPCSAARSAVSEASQFSLSLPACASTRSEDPTFTTMRRKSVNRGVFMAALFSEAFAKAVGRPALLQLGFVLQLRLVFEAIISGQPADQLAALPVVEDAADIFARDAGHGGEVALADLLADDYAA